MKNILTALMVFAAFGTSASAAEMKTEAGAALGSAIANGDWADRAEGGIGFDLSYEGYKLDDTFTVGASLFYTRAAAQNTTRLDYSAISYSALGITPYLKAEKDLGAQTVYGIFGLGLYNMRNTSGDIKSGGVVTGKVSSGSAYYPGVNLGGGVMYPLNDRMKIGGELKYHLVFASGVNPRYLVPAIKLTYSFGPVDIKKAPPAAAPIAAVVRVPDTDSDGVKDTLDNCLDTPAGTVVDAAGCPVAAPAAAEPAVAAPAAAEPAVVVPAAAEPAVSAAPACPWEQMDNQCQKLAMEFDSDKAELKSEFIPQLNEIAAFMSANPMVRVEMQGYTDKYGNEDYNLKLSGARANAVIKYLVETGGIEAGRLSARGMGKIHSASPDQTEEDRQATRRVIAILTQ